ncbi:hypothetical protein [Brachybacterium paraconglomeratum]|uniref:hypothetical protein n=1 Tax=Brachybacterium paraconglomeratum TaxID=173362 RepID=UPI0022AF7120|nr:hypothetical protein [Brachybacterium paraconglomeratum]MCZ4326763.1 hypothetical protein [Brachybacterium paraconglomeratum]
MTDSDEKATSPRASAVDSAMVEQAATTIRQSRRARRLLMLLAPAILAVLTVFTPAVAIAAGDGELQIGTAVYTETGRHVITGDTPVGAGTDGSMLLADGTILADGGTGASGAMTISQCGSIEENRSFSPVVRWAASGAYQEHHNSLSDDILRTMGRSIPAAFAMTASIPGDIGQAAWGMTAQITGFASDFCPIVSMGPRIDLLAGTIGQVVISSGLGAVLVAITVGLIAWRLVIGIRQGAGALKAAARSLVVPLIMGALLVTMVGAATSGLTNRDEAQGIYEPQVMSPGWLLTKTSETLGAVINVPMSALSNETVTESALSPATLASSEARAPGSCTGTVNTWRGSLAKDRHDVSPATDGISDLWSYSGIPYYVNYQFGGDDNALGWYAYCRVLDANANVYVAGDLEDTDMIDGTWHETFRKDYELTGTGGLNIMDSGALPKMKVTGEDQDQLNDAAILGWMICRTEDGGQHWTLIDGATNISGEGGFLSSGEEVTTQTCADWWTANNEDEVPVALKLEPGEEGVVDTGNADLDEALLTLHSTPKVPTADGVGLMLSGIVALIVFGAVSLVVMVSKVGVIVMGLFMIGAVIVGMWADTGQHVKRFGLRTLGLLLVTVVAQAVFVVIAVVSKILLSIGGSFFLGSVAMMAAWSALAPVVAIFILHYGAKSLIGTSPFTLQGAKTLATKGIDPGMLEGIASGASGLADRVRGGRRDRPRITSEDMMRSGRAQVSGAPPGKHDAIGAMNPAGEAHLVPAAGEQPAMVVGGPNAAAGAHGQGAAQRPKSQELGSMVASLGEARSGRGKGGKGTASLLNQVGHAADDAAKSARKDSRYGRIAGLAAGTGAAFGATGRGIASSVREGIADRRVLAAQRRDEWDKLSTLEKAARRTGQAGTFARGIGTSAWQNKGKLALAAGVGAVTVASAGTAAPALALGALAASGYGAKRAAGRAVTHPERARERHALAERAIHGMGSGSALAQRVQASEERQQLSAQASDARRYASGAAGAIGGGSPMHQRILDRVSNPLGGRSGADAVLAQRLQQEQERQHRQAELARSAAEAENRSATVERDEPVRKVASSSDEPVSRPTDPAAPKTGSLTPAQLGGQEMAHRTLPGGQDRQVPARPEASSSGSGSLDQSSNAPVPPPAPPREWVQDAPEPAPAPTERPGASRAGQDRPAAPSSPKPEAGTGPAALGGPAAPDREERDQ